MGPVLRLGTAVLAAAATLAVAASAAAAPSEGSAGRTDAAPVIGLRPPMAEEVPRTFHAMPAPRCDPAPLGPCIAWSPHALALEQRRQDLALRVPSDAARARVEADPGAAEAEPVHPPQGGPAAPVVRSGADPSGLSVEGHPSQAGVLAADGPAPSCGDCLPVARAWPGLPDLALRAGLATVVLEVGPDSPDPARGLAAEPPGPAAGGDAAKAGPSGAEEALPGARLARAGAPSPMGAAPGEAAGAGPVPGATSARSDAAPPPPGPLPVWLVAQAVAPTAALAMLYHRVARHRALEQATRRRIYEQVAATPGVRVGTLQGMLGLSYPALDRHVRLLERFGLLEALGGGQRRLFVAGALGAAEKRAVIAASAEVPARVLRHLRDAGATEFRSLRTALGLPSSTASDAVSRLCAAGLVAKRRAGRGLLVEPVAVPFPFGAARPAPSAGPAAAAPPTARPA